MGLAQVAVHCFEYAHWEQLQGKEPPAHPAAVAVTCESGQAGAGAAEAMDEAPAVVLEAAAKHAQLSLLRCVSPSADRRLASHTA